MLTSYILLGSASIIITVVAFLFIRSISKENGKLEEKNEVAEANREAVKKANQTEIAIDKLSDADVHNKLNDWVHPRE